jgi:hypothetical protein
VLLNRSRITVTISVLALVSITCYWIFHFPYAPGRTLHVIPSNAFIVTHHLELSKRCEEFVSNPFVINLVEASGINTQIFANVDLVKEYIRKETTFAFIPSEEGQQAQWVFATWLGKDAIMLRLKLILGLIRGFTRHTGSISVAYWVTPVNEHVSLHLAITQGMLIGCISSNSELMEYMLRQLEYGSSFVSEQKKFVYYDEKSRESRDFMWIILSSSAQLPALQIIKISFPEFSNTKIRGEIEVSGLDTTISKVPESELNSILPSARSIIGTNMCLLISMPSSFISILDRAPKMPKVIRFIYKLFERNISPNSYIWIAILDSQYKGKLFGMSIPVILAGGIKSETKANFCEETIAQIDRLNSELKCSFIPTTSSIQNTQVIVLNQVTRGLFDSFTETSKPVVFTSEKYYIIATDQKALARLSGTGYDTKMWWSDTKRPENTMIYIVSDLAKFQPVVSNILDVLRIASMLQGEEKSASLSWIDTVKRLFDIFKPFHILRFCWYKNGCGEIELLGDRSMQNSECNLKK